jgi:hypothetical protein
MLISASINPLKVDNSQSPPLTMIRIVLSISLSVLGSQILPPQVLQRDAPMERPRQRTKLKQQPVTPKAKILTAVEWFDAKGEILKC